MRDVLILRPEADGARTAARLQAMDLHPVVSPVLRIVPLDASFATNYDGLILTSPHALTAQTLSILPRSIPVYCVGARAAAVAEKAGFIVILAAESSIALCEASTTVWPKAGRMLYLSAEDVAGDMAQLLKPLTVERVITYRAEAVPSLNEHALHALREPEAASVLLTSERSTRVFVDLLGHYDLLQAVHELNAVCISVPVAETARGLGFTHVHTAAAPNEDGLIAALRTSC